MDGGKHLPAADFKMDFIISWKVIKMASYLGKILGGF